MLIESTEGIQYSYRSGAQDAIQSAIGRQPDIKRTGRLNLLLSLEQVATGASSGSLHYVLHTNPR